LARVPAGIANARARSLAAPIANRERQKSTAEGRAQPVLNRTRRPTILIAIEFPLTKTLFRQKQRW